MPGGVSDVAGGNDETARYAWAVGDKPTESVDELEQLIAGLLEDGEPALGGSSGGGGVVRGDALLSLSSATLSTMAVDVETVTQQTAAQMVQPEPAAAVQAARTQQTQRAAQAGASCVTHSTTHAVPANVESTAAPPPGFGIGRWLGMLSNTAQPAAPTKPQAPPLSSAPLPPAEFVWRECDSCLVSADLRGHPIDRTAFPARGASGLRVHIELQPQLLYWADRRQWMWHKKWSLPTMTVRVERGHSASSEGDAPPLATEFDRLYVVVTAGTLCDEGSGLEDQGLGGDCQRVLELRPQGATEVSFTRLLFQQTSFNCGGRPFHLVVTLLGAPPRAQQGGGQQGGGQQGGSQQGGEQQGGGQQSGGQQGGCPSGEEATAMDTVGPAPLKPLVCVCSSPVRVDARKRSKGERPEASEDDIRLVNRQRPAGLAAQGTGAPSAQSGNASASAASSAGDGSADASALRLDTDARFTTRALIDATSDAFIEVRPDGVVVQMLSSTAFGYTPAQLLGRSLLTICHTDEQPGLLQTMQALLMMACAERAGRREQPGASAATVPRSVPRTVRMLHRVIVGLGGERTAEAVAVDTILSVTEAAAEGTAPQTLLLSSRRALPVDANASAASFSFRIFPWPG